MVLPFPLVALVKLSVAALALGTLALRVLLPAWWRRPRVRGGVALLALAVAVGLAGTWLGGDSAWRFMMATMALLALAVPAALALPVAALARRAALPAPDAGSPPEGTALTRRAVVECVAAAVPLAASALSASAIASARGDALVPRVRMRFPSLAPELDGLRVLQLTDLHLGFDRDLDDLERALVRLARERADLVVVTGDLADDLALVAPALRMIAALRPRLGAYACLGNHEYHPGIRRTLREFERAPVGLLVDESETVRVGGARLAVLGVDDPLRSRENAGFYDRALARASRDVGDGAFRLLLCHRPDGFEPAARADVDLMLAGHTHGGQLGAGGRSLAERVGAATRPWGSYALGARRLYTSAGFGHWFPYRAGCPAEVPIIELARG